MKALLNVIIDRVNNKLLSETDTKLIFLLVLSVKLFSKHKNFKS